MSIEIKSETRLLPKPFGIPCATEARHQLLCPFPDCRKRMVPYFLNDFRHICRSSALAGQWVGMDGKSFWVITYQAEAALRADEAIAKIVPLPSSPTTPGTHAA